PIFSHKIGNIAVDAAIAIGFLWLVPMQSMSRRTRVLLTALATVIIAASGALNRGGAVAALVAILVICLLAGRRSMKMVGVMVGTVIVGFVLAWGLDVQVPVPGAQGRDISVTLVVDNIASISGASQQYTQLSATVAFRNDLWT